MPDTRVPEKPVGKTIACGGFEISYFTVGTLGAPCIMLVHGLAANGLQFVEDAHWFAQQGYFVIVPDLRGHGRSFCPRDVSAQDFTRSKLSNDLIEILRAENVSKLTWVGNSLGGILALEALRSHPNLFNRVVLFGTAFSLKIPLWLVKFFGLTYRLAGTSLTAAIGGFMTSSHPRARTLVCAMLREVQMSPVLEIGAHVSNYNLESTAQNFVKNKDGHILMLKAQGDKQVNDANASVLPNFLGCNNFEMIEIADAGHCANLDQPKLFRELVLQFATLSSSCSARAPRAKIDVN